MSGIYGNIANQYPTTFPTTGGNTLDSNINNLNQNLDNIQTKSNILLSQQEEIKKIVDSESSRLNYKKAQVDQQYPSKVRAVYMNDNLQKRYNAYLKILGVIVISLVIMFKISVVASFLPSIPPIILNIIHIVIVSVAVVLCMIFYTEIQTHDKMDYDKLKLNKPTDADSNAVISTSNTEASTLSSFGKCGRGTYLNDSGECTVNTSGFTGMNSGLQSLNTYEFTNYSRY